MAVSSVFRSASRDKHAGASLPTARSDGSDRLCRRVQPASHGRRLVKARPNARLPDRRARQGQQVRHAHPSACDIVRRGPVFVYTVLASRRRSPVRSRPRLRPWSVHTVVLESHKVRCVMGQNQ